jgi:hypothetical protein
MTRKQELKELKNRCCTKCKSGYIRGSDYNGNACYVGCKDEIIDVQKIGFYCSEFVAKDSIEDTVEKGLIDE